MGKFNAEQVGASIFIRCEDHLNRQTSTEVIGIIEGAFARAEKESGILWIVLDLRNKHELDGMFLRAVSVVAVRMRARGISLAVSNVSSGCAALISQSGLDSAIHIMTAAELDLERKVPKPSAPSPKIDVAFINPFLDGVLHVLKVQCSLTAISKAPILKQAAYHYPTDIAGVIGIVSHNFTGSVSICYPEATFLGIMSRMLGEPCTELTRELEDGAGEMLNMIFGHAKKILNEKGWSLDKAIPTIVRGKNLELRSLAPGPTVILPFSTEVGEFRVEIGVDRPLPVIPN